MSWNGYSLSSIKLDEIQNHDDFQIVWFGLYIPISKELINMIEFSHQYFTFDECENYIKSVKNDRSILLVLTDFFDCALDFDRYDEIHSIYILNRNQQEIDDEIRNSSKLTQIFNDENILIERLRYDIVLTYRNDLPISFSSIDNMKNDQSLIKLDGSTLFYWNQLFIHYLVNTQNLDMDQLKEQMIEECRSECKNNTAQLKEIDEFQKDCTLDNVLKWYTRASRIYQLVNKAFRTRNIDLICKFRYFIILLYNKLKALSNEQQGRNFTVLYRGQTIKDNELKILESNVGHLISFNTLISTSRNPAVAHAFASNPKNAIIFEIHMTGEKNNSLCPFADISEYSFFGDEEEILFFPGSTFRIDSIEKENDHRYRIKLVLNNEMDQLIQSLNDCLERFTTDISQICDLYPIVLDGYLFKKYYHYLTHNSLPQKEAFSLVANVLQNYLFSGSYDRTRSIDYYKRVLLDKTLINDEFKSIALHVVIGNNYFQNSEYDNAFLYYAMAYSSINGDNLLTAEIFSRFGDVWTALNYSDNAISCFQRAFDFIISDNDKDEKLIEICDKIMKICPKENYNQYAEKYETKAKEIIDHHKKHCKYIDKKTPLKTHQQGNICEVPMKFMQATQMFKEHYSMFDRFDYLLCINYELQAGVHLVSKDILSALIMWKKAIDIRMSLKLGSE
jgi:hypothetical protein